MAHLKVYENANSTSNKKYPYLLDVQTNLLSDLRTTVVIPLAPASSSGNMAITKLCPIVDIKNKRFVAMTQQLAGVERKALGKEVGDLSTCRAEIISALDFLITGI